MAGAASSIGAVGQLGKSQQAHSLFKHEKNGAKAGKAMGNQQQFASLLAGKQAALQGGKQYVAPTDCAERPMQHSEGVYRPPANGTAAVPLQPQAARPL